MGDQSLLLLSCGATAFLAAGPEGRMVISLTAHDLLGQALKAIDLSATRVLVKEMGVRSGAELTWQTLLKISDAVLRPTSAYISYVLIIGTDTLDEAAFALHLLLEPHLRAAGKCLVVTGAMRPSDQLGSDGPANLAQALMLATDPTAQATGTVLVALNDSIHLGSRVLKSDSQLMGAFCSHPGPAGQFRGGRPLWAWQPLPSPLPEPAFAGLTLSQLRQRVAIWTVTVDAFLPEQLLQAVDGLVLAAPGTGSLPSSMIEQLAGHGDGSTGSSADGGQGTQPQAAVGVPWTHRLPIVICSRCVTGESVDEYYYKGSRHKYESRGFLLRGYESLTPLQARTLLMLRLALHGRG